MENNRKDPMFDEAVELVSRQKTCSPATLQTRLAVGYIRARRILEQMEFDGIVGSEDAKGVRTVFKNNMGMSK